MNERLIDEVIEIREALKGSLEPLQGGIRNEQARNAR